MAQNPEMVRLRGMLITLSEGQLHSDLERVAFPAYFKNSTDGAQMMQ